MEFPKRISAHISESASFKALSSALPDAWIIREVTERDYGVDLYVELVRENNAVTGDMVALQVKSTSSLSFNSSGGYSFSGIKKSTINYWRGLPVPVFVVLVNLENGSAYWSSMEMNDREGRLSKPGSTASIKFEQEFNFSDSGLLAFWSVYLREKRWPDIERAIENSLMAYNTLGPLVLMCKRMKDEDFCTSTVQFMLNQHYENFCLLFRYLMQSSPKHLPHWYARHVEYLKDKKLPASPTFSFGVAKEMIDYFVWDYRDCIIAAYELVTKQQKSYFEKKLPYLSMHLSFRPHAFVADDWSARYYFDEYESETQHPEKLFFEDFVEFDFMLNELTKT